MSADFEQMMAELRTEYLASFPQKFADIESSLKAQDFSRLRDHFHKLKGTGKTYGIPEISELCAKVEQICLDASGSKAAQPATPQNTNDANAAQANASEAVRIAIEKLHEIVKERATNRAIK